MYLSANKSYFCLTLLCLLSFLPFLSFPCSICSVDIFEVKHFLFLFLFEHSQLCNWESKRPSQPIPTLHVSLSLSCYFSRAETAELRYREATSHEQRGPVWSLLNVFSAVRVGFERWQGWEWSDTLQMLFWTPPSLELLQLGQPKLFSFFLCLSFSPLPCLSILQTPQRLQQSSWWPSVVYSKVPACPVH